MRGCPICCGHGLFHSQVKIVPSDKNDASSICRPGMATLPSMFHALRDHTRLVGEGQSAPLRQVREAFLSAAPTGPPGSTCCREGNAGTCSIKPAIEYADSFSGEGGAGCPPSALPPCLSFAVPLWYIVFCARKTGTSFFCESTLWLRAPPRVNRSFSGPFSKGKKDAENHRPSDPWVSRGDSADFPEGCNGSC